MTVLGAALLVASVQRVAAANRPEYRPPSIAAELLREDLWHSESRRRAQIGRWQPQAWPRSAYHCSPQKQVRVDETRRELALAFQSAPASMPRCALRLQPPAVVGRGFRFWLADGPSAKRGLWPVAADGIHEPRAAGLP